MPGVTIAIAKDAQRMGKIQDISGFHEYLNRGNDGNPNDALFRATAQDMKRYYVEHKTGRNILGIGIFSAMSTINFFGSKWLATQLMQGKFQGNSPYLNHYLAVMLPRRLQFLGPGLAIMCGVIALCIGLGWATGKGIYDEQIDYLDAILPEH